MRHPIVQAVCDRGLIQCSDAGGSAGDDSAGIREQFEGLDSAANLVGAGTFAGILFTALAASLTAVGGLLTFLVAVGGLGLSRTIYNALFVTG
jgi:hypothetical protein